MILDRLTRIQTHCHAIEASTFWGGVRVKKSVLKKWNFSLVINDSLTIANRVNIKTN